MYLKIIISLKAEFSCRGLQVLPALWYIILFSAYPTMSKADIFLFVCLFYFVLFSELRYDTKILGLVFEDYAKK